MPRSLFVDFKAVKEAVSMEQVLGHYNLLDEFKRGGDSLSGPCPIHKGTNPTQFRVSISKNVWNCFSECKHGGNVLDFISRMEGVSIHAAALKAINWFHLDPHATSSSSNGEKDEESENGETSLARTQVTKKPVEVPENATPNKPLKFRLEKLEREHSYLKERGLSLETIIDFGIGFCSKGMMAGRIAIPIHNVDGEVVAYAGRFLGDPPEGTPKYKLPQGFRKSLELFNIDRAIKEGPGLPLVVVEGFFYDELKAYFTNPEAVASHLLNAQNNLKEKEQLLQVQKGEIGKVREQMKQAQELYFGKHITPEGFGELYKPLEQRLGELQAELPKLEAEVDAMKINNLSADEVLSEANELYSSWPKMPIEDKRRIVEGILEKVVIGPDDGIELTLAYLPTSEKMINSQQHLSVAVAIVASRAPGR